MRAIASLIVAGALLVAGTALADDSSATAAEAAQTKVTKSRSNIQNNREAPPPAKDDAATPSGTQEPAQVVKTKTKSNQSND